MLKICHGLLFILAMIISGVCLAHQSSHSQISLWQTGNLLKGAWSIAIEDLERSEGLDVDGDGELSWGELIQKKEMINSLAKAHLRVRQSQSICELSTSDLMLDKLTTGLYVYLPIKIQCPRVIRQLSIEYDFLFSFDAQHKAILNIKSNDVAQSFIFNNHKRGVLYDSLIENKSQTFFEYMGQGIWHIWIGIDHVLFLLSLLLPAALIFHQGVWLEKQNFKQTLINTTKIVSAFTLAHSITLALSVFGWEFISSRVVESVIAASVIIAALNNIKPVVHQRLWLLIFIFGLIHGMGFASVLNDVGLPVGLEVLALFGFNIGVELGQLSIVAIMLPLIYVLSRWNFYRKTMLQLSSLVIVGFAVIWLIERVADIEIFN